MGDEGDRVGDHRAVGCGPADRIKRAQVGPGLNIAGAGVAGLTALEQPVVAGPRTDLAILLGFDDDQAAAFLIGAGG